MFVKVLALIIGYFLGSIPFSYLFGKWFGHDDVRKYGSGNVGTTNVMRAFGKKVGVLAFIGDFLKGAAAVLIGKAIGGLDGAVIAGTCAVIGHCYSVFLNFTGGKGVATSAGAVGAIMPMVLLFGGPAFALVAWLSGYVSVASLSVFVLAFVLSIVWGKPLQVTVMIAMLVILAFYRHWGNIGRLLRHEEPKIKRRSREEEKKNRPENEE